MDQVAARGRAARAAPRAMIAETLDLAQRHGWRFVVLRRHAKTPYAPGGRHVYIEDRDAALRAFNAGHNLGLAGHNLAVVDFDDEQAREVLFAELGPLPLSVRTASGKHHAYLAPDPALPARVYLAGRVVGDIRRLPTEYVVAPPSWLGRGEPYRWIEPPRTLAPLPLGWRRYLDAARPAHDQTGQPFEIPTEIREGERQRTFYRWTRSWKAQGFTLSETLDILRVANANITRPPWPEDELVREATRAFLQPDRPR